jgi:WD40 repeat protein
VWDASSGREMHVLKGHRNFVYSVEFSPDGSRLASASGDRTAKLWDVATGQELLTLRGHTDELFSVAFSPDGCWLATAGRDQTVKLWDARPLTPQIELEREALSFVEFLFAKSLSKKEVIAKIRTSEMISESLRHEALHWAERFRNLKLNNLSLRR